MPRSVWALTLLFAAMLSMWSLLAPATRGPDEAGHIDLVMRLSRGGDYPAYDDHHPSTALFSLWLDTMPGLDLVNETRYLTAENAVPRADRKDFETWGGDAPAAGAHSQLSQHPPLYYQVMAPVLRGISWLWPTHPALDQTTSLLRLANVALVSPLPLLAWAAASRLGARGSTAVTAAAVPLAVPQLVHIGSVVNNDNLLTLLAGVLSVLVAGVLRGDDRATTAVAIGVVGGLALFTKGFAFALMPWIASIYLVHARRSTRPRRSIARLAVVGGVATITGGWWMLRNLIRYGKPLPSILDEPLSNHPPGFEARPLWYARHFASTITQRFWGDFGSYEAPIGQALVIAVTVLVAVLVVTALQRPQHTATASLGPGLHRADLAWFSSAFLFLLALVAYRAFSLYRSSGELPFIQGRYLFAAIVPFAVIVGAGAHRLAGRWAPLGVVVVAGVLQVDAKRTALRGWWAEPSASVSRSVDAWLAWMPWPQGVAYAAALVVLASACWVAWCLVVDATRQG